MNKKEIAEIKRLFHPDRCPVTRICGCYVDGDKNIKTEFAAPFFSLPEEEMFKYFEILKKAMSGKAGKNQTTIEIQKEEKAAKEYLLALRDSKLKDEELLCAFYNMIIEIYKYVGSYYIVLAHGAYDVPGRAKNNTEIFDASEEVYEFILCAICPVGLDKPSLGYNEDKNVIENRIRGWYVEEPAAGFLFPAFEGRSADIDRVQYYSKSAKDRHEELVKMMTGAGLPLSAEEEKERFQALLTDCTYEMAKGINEALCESIELHRDDPAPVSVGINEVIEILTQYGAGEEQQEQLREGWTSLFGDEKKVLSASNLINTGKLEIKTPGISIQATQEKKDLIEIRVIDGEPYLMIPAGECIEFGGIQVAMKQDPEEEA